MNQTEMHSCLRLHPTKFSRFDKPIRKFDQNVVDGNTKGDNFVICAMITAVFSHIVYCSYCMAYMPSNI